MAERVLIGAIAGAHGVRGQVRIRSFTGDPAAVAAYGPVMDEAGQRFRLTVTGAVKGGVTARIDGISDRAAAAALRGVRLYVPREALPATEEGEYYRTDLIGLRAELKDGSAYGRIVDVQNYGAGDLIEVERPGGESEFLPFTATVAPVVDVAGGRIVIEPPGAVEAGPEEAGADDAA